MNYTWRFMDRDDKRTPRIAAKTLYLYDEHSDRNSYIGLVKRIDRRASGAPDVWRVMIHELTANDYLSDIEDMRFATRSVAMRELRKRFTVAWIGATPDERENVWD